MKRRVGGAIVGGYGLTWGVTKPRSKTLNGTFGLIVTGLSVAGWLWLATMLFTQYGVTDLILYGL